MSNISQAVVRLSVCFFALVFSASTIAIEEVAKPSPARFLEVVVMKGKELPALLNSPVADYSIMAVHKGKLSSIPYQFDDKNIRGLTYVEGGILAVDGKVGILEEKDELVFMYKDMGIKAEEATKTLSAGKNHGC